MKQVLVNTTSLLPPITGIGTYTLNLMKALEQRNTFDMRYFYGTYWSQELTTNIKPQVNLARKTYRRIGGIARPLIRKYQQARFSLGSRQYSASLYHEPNFIPYSFKGPTAITIHDLSILRYPETHPVDRVRFMEKHLPTAISKSSAIFVVSNFVKQELLEFYPSIESKIHLTYNGVDESFKPASEITIQNTLKKYGLQANSYFLVVSTLEPRKNIVTAIKAFMELPSSTRKRFPLIMVGSQGWLFKDTLSMISPLIEREEIKILGFIETHELITIYSGALSLVYPSLYEGFGLPVLEAMSCGTPVITSNSTALAEVVGDSGIKIDPLDHKMISAAMSTLIESKTLHNELALQGIKRSKDFTWDKCAEKTEEIYNAIIND